MLQAADYLEQAEYNTGNPIEDLKTRSLVRQLLYNPKFLSACPVPFDEAKLWQGENGPELKQQIQKQFRNIRFAFGNSTCNLLDMPVALTKFICMVQCSNELCGM